MAERVLAGASASPGLAAGAAQVVNVVVESSEVLPAESRDAAATQALAALESAALRLQALAAAVSGDEAEILEANVMMARDPALAAAVEAEVRERGAPAAAALVAGADRIAATLAAIDDEMLAARADDVRSIGTRAARIALGEDEQHDVEGSVVLVATDLGPADVAELHAGVCAIGLAAGAVTAHAAIVARARGIPMVVAVGDGALAAERGSTVVVDGDAGRLVLDPSLPRVEAARESMRAAEAERERSLAASGLAAVTRDGRRVRVLVNAASAVEVETGLAAGAEGAGLIRTELAFLEARAWPSEDEHRRMLDPVLAPLRGRTATVRVLDFGGDKTPPFLNGTSDRALRLLLAAPDAFEAQLRAIVQAADAAACDLRVLLPMVNSAVELVAARELLERAAPDAARTQLGAMIETPRAAGLAFQIASGSDFLSIGTNDLTHATLGSDRFAAAEATTSHPKVLRAIDRSVRAARSAGVPIEVCGEAASDPEVLPLLVGLGVDELSVGAARVGQTRAWVRELDYAEARRTALAALESDQPAIR
jgi:phosphoenolpyruvate-protein kinase (PTS system EI component)